MPSQTPSESQSRWQELEQMFESSPMGLALLDRDLRYLRANPAICRISQIPLEQRIGRTLPELYPQYAPIMVPLMRQVMDRREAVHGVESRVQVAGEERVIIASYLPVCEPNGSCNKLCVVAYDATELRRTEAEAQQARAAAEAANRAKDQFIAALSHELRTPLTPVLASVSLLQERADLPAPVQAELAMIRRNVELEARLIDDLLDVTRVAHGKITMNREPTDVHSALRDALSICRDEICHKTLRIDLDLSAAQATVLGDPARLRQIFWNVVSNAVKFTPNAGRVIVRTSVASQSPPVLTVRVTDTGIGIDPSVLPKVFAPFEQGEGRITRQFGGLGLGLTITKALVDLHGGAVEVTSPGAGQGTTVTVTLPLHTTAPAQAPSTARPAPGAGKTLRVLLVDDHVDTLKVMARLLASFGCQVTTAASVAASDEAVQAGEFDLLISDLGLPDGSGIDVLTHFRRRHTAPAIALSGYGMEDDVRGSLSAGFARHLTKPVDVVELRRAIGIVTGEQGS